MSSTKIIINGNEVEVGGNAKNYSAGSGISIEGETISVALPVKAVTAAEYDDLSEEEKMADIQYMITDDNEGSGVTSVYVQEEYDTTSNDGATWHVKKWNNGFLEMFGRHIVSTASFNQALGNMYRSDSLYRIEYPFALFKIYNASIEVMYSKTSSCRIWPAYQTENELTSTWDFYFFKHSTGNATHIQVGITVIGLWKPFVSISTSSVMQSETARREDEKYECDMNEDVLSFGSSAQEFK